MSYKCFVCLFMVGVNFFIQVVYADDVVWGVDVSVAKQHQSFDASTADLETLSVDPSFQYDKWDFSFSVPWYKSEGEYYLDGIRPFLTTRCTKLQSLSPANIQKLINRGKLTEKQISRCELFMEKLSELNEPHSGIGDVTGFAHYSFAMGRNDVWRAITGLGYKTDSGDSKNGLGSGTKDVMFEFGVNAVTGRNLFNLVIGYDSVMSSNDFNGAYKPENYAYSNVEFSRLINHWLTLGAIFNLQQSNIAEGDATKSITGYVDFAFMSQWNLHCYATHYNNTQSSPNSEIGANLRYAF